MITSVNHDTARFLSTRISRVKVTTYGRRRNGFKIRDNKTLRLTAPIDIVVSKLTKTGILKGGAPSPK